MDIPKLKRNSRSREYDKYSEAQRAEVVRSYLFKGLSHRRIDRDVLDLDMDSSKGWQSMGILHFLGLNNPFKGLFFDMTVEEAIQELKDSVNDDYSDIIYVLQKFVT